VTLLTLWSEPAEKNDLEQIRQYCDKVYAFKLTKSRSYWNCITTLPTPDPLQSVYCWEPEAGRWACELIKKGDFDVVHIEHMRGAKYGLISLNGRQALHQTPIVWDSVDSISYLFRQASSKSKTTFSRLITAFELKRTEKYESRLLNTFDHVLVTSPNDRRAFLALGNNVVLERSISVVNNGVDLDYFFPDEAVQRAEDTLVVSGKLSYHANINMVFFLVNQIMPHVWRERPETKLIIVGKDPPREITGLGEKPGITVTGTVKDIRPYLRMAAIAVAPITYGAGIQNKVLEAMACGTPVISTSMAVSALAVLPGQDVLVRDEPQEYAREVLNLLENRDKRQELGAAGRRFVEDHHNWDTIISELEVIYNKVIKQKQATFRERIF
jgi:polysaccharide biosynthesis protein PslH